MKDIKKWVEECAVCQLNKSLALTPAGFLQPLPIQQHIWEDVSMDFIKKLPKLVGFDLVLVIVDRPSKYAHFLPLKTPFTASGVTRVFAKEVVRLHGIPRSIVSKRFLSHFWTKLFRLQVTRFHGSTAYHPQSDGQTEVVNRCVETYL